jgi:hypothetical protein
MAKARAREPLLVSLATLGLAVLLYPGALLRGEAFFERDLHLDWYPRLAAIGRALSQGAWPLWEPGLGFGQPLLADPSVQLLYPVTWLALALPWSVAYTAFVLVHLAVAGAGAFRLAGRLGAGRAGAWTAALLFVLSGPVQSAVNLWHHFSGIAWMPWVLLAVDTLVRRPGARACVGLAVSLALQVLAGSADLCAMTLALALPLAALRLSEPRRRSGLRAALGWTAAALALSAALTCALWWPAAEAVSRSARRGLPEDVRTAWSIPAAGLARLFAPLDPARVPFEPSLWTRLYDRPVHPLLFSVYLGLPALGLVGASLLASTRRGRALGLAALAFLAVGLSMGPHAPLYGPLSWAVPVLRIFRYPSKALWAASLATALGAGLGVRALAGLAPLRRLSLSVALFIASLGVAFVTSRVHAEAYWAPALGAVFALVLALLGRGVQPRLGRIALTALALADLTAAHQSLNATLPARLLLEPPALVAPLRSIGDGQRVHIWDYQILPGTSERLLGRSDAYRAAAPPPGVDRRVLGFVAQRQFLVPPTAAFFGLETSYDLDNRGLFPRDLNDLCNFLRYVEGTSVHTRLLRMGAVEKVVVLHETGLEELRVEASFPSLMGEPMRVLDLDGALPRARLVGRTRIADGVDALRALSDGPFDPRDEAIVATGAPLLGAPGPAGSVRWLERRADRQRLETTSARPSLLVEADTYDPGWRATVDGAAAPLVRANVAFRGVLVPEGRHVVELVYRPRSVVWGAVVGLVGLVVAVGLRIAGRRVPRRRRRQST